MISCIFAAFTSFFISFYVIPFFMKAACRLRVVDLPDDYLKGQEKAVPYLGGVAVYLGFLVSIALWLPFKNNLFLLLIGITILLIVGLIDDIFVLSPISKIVGQLFGVLCFLKAGFFLKENFLNSSFNILVSLFWFLTVINAFNLVDVMDGLATSLALVSSLVFLILAIIFNYMPIVILLSAFIGSLLAFLFYNKTPAKIYLGDAGALFIGGFFGAIPFFFSWSEVNFWGFGGPLFFLFIPLLEFVSLILIRTYKGIPFFRGSKDHFSLYLLNAGWKKQNILLLSVACALFWGILGLYWVLFGFPISILFLILLFFLSLWILLLIKS